MRILSIEGANLASLVGEFRVDFSRAPFDRGGLFAIVGPTGAGKSTILDAMCLALFDRAPRFDDASAVLVGSQSESEQVKLRANDVRSIVTRGQAEGHASVVFLGGDGRRYRATWHVRRAHGRPDGRMQAQSMALALAETGQSLGDPTKKRQILELIVSHLGLTYDQFRRSVLLAQGDFSAFLRAGADERAELLERMTGTALYSRLSRAAFSVAKEELVALSALRQRYDALTAEGLPESHRRELAERLSEYETALQRLDGQLLAAQRGVSWHHELTRRREAESLAQSVLIQRQQRWEQGQAERANVELQQRLLPLLPLWRLWQQLEQDSRGQRAGLTELDAQIVRLDQAVAIHGEALAAAQHAVAAVEQASAEMEGPLQRAAELEHELAQLSDALARQESAHQEIAMRWQAMEDQQQAIAQAIGEVERQQREITAAREREPHLVALAESGASWGAVVEGHVETLEEAQQCDAERRALSEAGESLLAAQRDRQREVDQTRQRVSALSQQLDDLPDTPSPVTLQQTQQPIVALMHRLSHAAQLHSRWIEAREQLGQHESRCDELDQSWQAEAQRRQQILEQRATLLGDGAHTADDAALLWRLRETLHVGDPCPVCGATAHPRLSAPAPGDLASVHAALAELDQALAASTQALDALASDRAAAASTRAGAAGQAAGIEAQIADLLQGTELDGTAPRVLNAPLAEAIAQARAQQEAAAAAMASWERRQGLEQQLTAAREAHAVAQQRLRDHERELHANAQSREHTQARWTQLSERATRQCDQLRERFGGDDRWIAELQRAPRDAFNTLRSAVAAAIATGQQLEDQRDRARELSAQRDVLTARQAEIAAQRESSQAQCRQQREALADRRRERGALLQGRAVAEVRDEQRAVAAQAKQRLDEAQGAFRQADQALLTVRVQREQASLALEETLGKCAACEQDLHEGLQPLGLELTDVSELMALDPAAVAARREIIEAERRALSEAETLYRERMRARESQQANEGPEVDLAQLEQDIAAYQLEREALRQAVYDSRHRLEQDQERQSAVSKLGPAIADQEARTAVWQQLNQLIGSADGKKFRVFAQSLALQQLVDEANAQLADLAPRYLLQRVPASHLALQVVDRDMGDAIRGTNSLSGGESFLVSLALALALSAMSAKTTPIGSLFIDEGFGALDSETLDVALSVLDALQSAGRQIGVISHIDGLAERIGVQLRVLPSGGGASEIVPFVGTIALPTADP